MRKVEHGLFYFPLDCDFFRNKKIKNLRRAQGSVGILTYINILCRVYENGYYFTFDDVDSLVSDITEDIAYDKARRTEAQVRDAISYLIGHDMIDRSLFERNVISGLAIQEQYAESIKKLKRKAEIDLYSLLPKKEEGSGVGGSTPKIQNSSEFNAINSEEMRINSEEKQQKGKGKEKGKENILYTPSRVRGTHQNVVLSEAEYSDLKSRIPDADGYINRFSEKLYSKGYSYSNHYDAIIKWWDEDKHKSENTKKNEAVKPKQNSSFDTDDFFAAAVARSRRPK